MKISKKVRILNFCLVMLLVLSIIMVAGCGGQKLSNQQDTSAVESNVESDNNEGKGDQSNDNDYQVSTEDKIKIVFWHNWSTGPSGESIQKSVEEFNKSQDKIVVEPLFVATDGGDSITSKLLTAVAGGTPPDVMLASRYGIAEYMDALTILNDLAERDNINGDMFYEWAWNEARYNGQLLGLPYDGTARALFYNFLVEKLT